MRKFNAIAKSVLCLPVAEDDDVAQELIKAGVPKEKITQKDCVIFGVINKAKRFGDVKALEKLQEFTNEETTSLLIEIKREELALKRKELELKEQELKARLNQGRNDDSVIIVHDLDELNAEDSKD